jgi:hypothetical protein
MQSHLWNASQDSAKPEMIISATLYLMSSYSQRNACPRLAMAVFKHLKLISESHAYPDVLRATCLQLMDQWEGSVQVAMQTPTCPLAVAPTPAAPKSGLGALSNVLQFRRQGAPNPAGG